MPCFCMLHCILDVSASGITPWKARFTEDFRGPAIPFGALIEYYPISEKDHKRLEPFGSKLLPGLFIGYQQQCGGGWSGDLIIVDIQQVETSVTFSDIHPKRFKADEVRAVKKSDKFVFPIADGNVKLGYTEGESRKYNIHQIRREVLEEQVAEDLDGILPDQPANGDWTDFLDQAGGDPERSVEDQTASGDAEQISSFDPASNIDFWSITEDVLIRHHRIPRLSQFTLNEEGLEVPIPIRYVDVTRSIETSIDNPLESRMHDVWTKNQKVLSEHWTGRTLFDLLKPPIKA